MAEAKQQPKGQAAGVTARRGAEVAQRAKATRKGDSDKAMRHGNVGSGDRGPFGGI